MKAFMAKLVKNTKKAISRFFTTFCLIIGLFFVRAYLVILLPVFEPSRWTVLMVWESITLAISFGILLCTLGTLIYEKYHHKIKIDKIFVDVALLILSGFTYLPLRDFGSNAYIVSGYFGVMAALFLCIMFFSTKESVSKTFSHIVKSTMFNIFVCGIIMGGASLCIFAFDSLILSLSRSWIYYEVTALFVFIIIFLNLSLSALPGKDTVLNTPKAFKVVVMYAMLPTYLLLLAILCGHLLRILFTLNFPSGQINWLVSVASLLFIFFVFSLEQYRKENKLAELFLKFAGFVIIPIIAMQFWAIHIRVSAYGLTAARYVSIVFNILALVFAVISLVKKGRFIKYMLLVVAGVGLIITMTPLNLIDVPVRNQTARLVSLLRENNMLDDGRIVPRGDISVEDRIRITSAFRYIRFSDAEMPDFLVGVTVREFEEVFGFDQEFARARFAAPPQDELPQVRWGRFGCDWCNCYNYYGIDVTGFSRIHEISESGEEFSMEISGEVISYNIRRYIVDLYNEHGLNYHALVEIDFGENRLVLNSVSFYIRQGEEPSIEWFGGFLLTR